MEHCLAPILYQQSPSIDLAQGGLRVRRSSLDQALCLHEMIQIHRRRHGTDPVLAFLDIKAAYDTVDRNVIWSAFHEAQAPPPLLCLHLFDDVITSVIHSNQVSSPTSPVTGVLQRSVISPHLYSIMLIPSPQLSAKLPHPSVSIQVYPHYLSIHSCFADDIALIGTRTEVQGMLDIAASHSHRLGYRFSPSKCATLNATSKRPLNLYNEALRCLKIS
jgi:hypothetical protein